MMVQIPEWDSVVHRLEKVEKQNRRLKQTGALASILIASVLLMGQASPKRTVEANEFVLRDANGKERAWLGVIGSGPMLALYDASGKERVRLVALAGGSNFALFNANGEAAARLAVIADAPTLDLSDKEGFQTTIGTADLITPGTGETSKTSAASMVLFDKDKKVLWKAP